MHTLFANAAVPGVTSTDVLEYQIPQVERFSPDVIVMTVGGNDLIAVIEQRADLESALSVYKENLQRTLFGLCGLSKAPYVYVSNIYNVPELGPDVNSIIGVFNKATEDVITAGSGCTVKLADVNAAFAGRKGLLNIERNGADPFEVHPTTAGHRVMAEAFKQVINQ